MSGCRVFIGRLNPAAREKDVERFFKGYGRIRDIDLKRGFGFVVSIYNWLFRTTVKSVKILISSAFEYRVFLRIKEPRC